MPAPPRPSPSSLPRRVRRTINYSASPRGDGSDGERWYEVGPRRPGLPARALQAGSGHDVLLPVREAREILPRGLALSEGCRALEEGDVDEADVLGTSRLRHSLGDHLSHERNGNAAQAVQYLVGAADPGARQQRSLGGLVGSVLTCLGHQLLQAQRDVV